MNRPWHAASVVGEGAPYGIHLDGKAVRTPLKRTVEVPTRALAEAIVGEWLVQGDKIAPDTMPLTRYMNSVIDTVTDNRQSVINAIAAYAETDLLCYRAAHPVELVQRQSEAWDEPLTTLAKRYGAPMVVTTGILPVEQPAATLSSIRSTVEIHDNASLAALYDLTALSGSIILALAISDETMTPDNAWTTSRIDEEWQIEQWGEDDIATNEASVKRASFMDAVNFLMLAREE